MSILNFFTNRNIAKEDRYILCIDGGGMRGVVPVKVLQKLEQCVREAGGTKALQSYFDLIVGTSTGGLITASLAFPNCLDHVECSDTIQTNLKTLENMYMHIGKSIFPGGNPIRELVNTSYQVVSEKYSALGLENVLNNMFGETKLKEAVVPSALLTYDLAHGKGEVLSSYGSMDMTVSQACRATSAAPTYFAPMQYEDKLYADGGLVANNPSLYAYCEARKLYPECTHFHILSLGTAATVHRTELGSTSGLINWIDQLSPMFMTAQKDTVEYALKQIPGVEYIRVDKEFNQSIRLDDIRDKSMKALNQFGSVVANEYETNLRAFASTLVR